VPGEDQEQQQEDRQQRARADLGQIQGRLVIDDLTSHTLVVARLRVMLVQQPDAVKSQQAQQRALDDPAGPAQSSITAVLSHALLCKSRKAHSKVYALEIHGARNEIEMQPIGAQAPSTHAKHADSVVELSEVRFSWQRGGDPVIDISALRIARGERVFLRGPSGSGKSTLLSLLAGVITPQQGSIKVLGQDIGTLGGPARDRFRADHVGFIFQMFNLIPYLSVVENVRLPCGFSQRRRANAQRAGGSVDAEALRLLEHLDMTRDGLLRRPVTELSVGQQQRVAAARALIGAPELVIADEPTSSLDADRRMAFIDLLFAECKREQATLIFVSHDATLAELFDRAIELAAVNRTHTPSVVAAAA
jgi:putative ABC transport system ATP-binding protein